MSTNLTKREIVLEIYEKTGFPQKQIQDTVQMTLDIVMDALAAGRNVELRNFGVLEVQVRKARVGRNPNKPETEVVIPERAVGKLSRARFSSRRSSSSASRKCAATRRRRLRPERALAAARHGRFSVAS